MRHGRCEREAPEGEGLVALEAEHDNQLSVAVLGWPAVEREFGDGDTGSAEEDQCVGGVGLGEDLPHLGVA